VISIISDIAFSPSSVAVNQNTYFPGVDRLVIVVVYDKKLVIDAVEGPESCLHETPAIVPSASVAVPATVIDVVGKVIV